MNICYGVNTWVPRSGSCNHFFCAQRSRKSFEAAELWIVMLRELCGPQSLLVTQQSEMGGFLSHGTQTSCWYHANWIKLVCFDGEIDGFGVQIPQFERHPEFEDYWNVYQYMAMGQKVWYSVEH